MAEYELDGIILVIRLRSFSGPKRAGSLRAQVIQNELVRVLRLLRTKHVTIVTYVFAIVLHTMRNETTISRASSENWARINKF